MQLKDQTEFWPEYLITEGEQNRNRTAIHMTLSQRTIKCIHPPNQRQWNCYAKWLFFLATHTVLMCWNLHVHHINFTLIIEMTLRDYKLYNVYALVHIFIA